MNISDFLNKDLIFLQEHFENTDELFQFIGMTTHNLGLSKETYTQALKDREASFPTGIQTEHIGVAIPHADSSHLTQEFISVITMKDFVEFTSMEDFSETVKAQVVFVLGLKKSEDQLNMLQKIVEIIQDEEKMKNLLVLKDVDQVINLLG